MNLVELALAAERFTQSQPPITLTAIQCVRTRNKSADCDRCVQACPMGAIRLEDGIRIDMDACIRCGLCLHICPTGAISGTDQAHRLLYCASQLVDHDTVEIACAQHPNPAPGNAKTDAVITTTGCLAALGASAYLGLAVQNVRQVRVRLDACAECPLSSLQTKIEATIQQANDLLDALGGQQTVAAADPPAHPRRRPVYSVKNPPVSRRGFFQALGQGTRDCLPLLTKGHERERLINTLQQLDSNDPDQPMPGSDFTTLTISDACNACTTCARICPTGALEFARNEEQFQITFSAAACVNCDLCLSYCEPQAIQHGDRPTISEVASVDVRVLHSGALTRCRRCSTRFAGKSDDGLCPNCSFRLKHPFGARRDLLPEARRMPEAHLIQKDN